MSRETWGGIDIGGRGAMGAVVSCTYSTTLRQNNRPKITKVPALTRAINLPVNVFIKPFAEGGRANVPVTFR